MYCVLKVSLVKIFNRFTGSNWCLSGKPDKNAQEPNVVNEVVQAPNVVAVDERVELFVFGFDNQYNLINYFTRYGRLDDVQVGFVSYYFKTKTNFYKYQ